jgi:KipI family sensor histidine kinase inhibitor
MTRSIPVGEVRVLGDRAFLIGVDDAAAGRALARALDTRLAGAGTVEVLCGSATVAVALVDPDTELEPVRAAAELALADMARRATSERGVARSRLVTVPCTFDGPDLEEVAARAGCSPAEVVVLMTARVLTVSVVGFSPGFAYLDGVPGPLREVPRRDRPRPVVPAGSVALASGHAAVYPTASPGGWQLVGRSGFPFFTAERSPYAVLAPGDRVRFTVAGAGDPVDPPPVRPPPWSPPGSARPVLQVVASGLRAVVQDGGRRAVAAVGIPGAGPADPVSFALANRLVGNGESAGALELTGGGTKLRCREVAHVAVVGAAPEVRVDGAAVPAQRLVPVAGGQLLEVGPLRRGCRTYLSVAGGFVGPEMFGSSASDELCGMGAGPLAPGRVLHAERWAPPLGDHLLPATATEVDPGGPPLELRVVAGPHPERFEPDALARLADLVFRVEKDSNRVGIRLRQEGRAVGLRRSGPGGELDSQGVVTGAVQVPPDGDPVILMPDHATLGGYPVLAVVASADHGLLGQCGPGTRVRLVPFGHAEADVARRARRRAMETAVVGHYPLSAG